MYSYVICDFLSGEVLVDGEMSLLAGQRNPSRLAAEEGRRLGRRRGRLPVA